MSQTSEESLAGQGQVREGAADVEVAAARTVVDTVDADEPRGDDAMTAVLAAERSALHQASLTAAGSEVKAPGDKSLGGPGTRRGTSPSALFRSRDPRAHHRPGAREEEWRFTPLDRLSVLLDVEQDRQPVQRREAPLLLARTGAVVRPRVARAEQRRRRRAAPCPRSPEGLVPRRLDLAARGRQGRLVQGGALGGQDGGHRVVAARLVRVDGVHDGAGRGDLHVRRALAHLPLPGQRLLAGLAHPTAPSICSSMSRFSSSAYSIGSSRATGSTNPRTIIAMASSSLSPRCCR